MLPVYGQMNSYPHQSNQVPFNQHYIPTTETQTLPHQMGPNPPNFPTMYMPWPHVSNYGYPTPCHVCCSHNGYPGGYYPLTPPCPNHVLAPPLHCNHSAFPQAYPVQYDPPHYSTVQRESHCCGCANHTCHQKEDKGVKIEEMDEGTGKKSIDSLIPVRLGNHPYQVVWVPSELVKKDELKGHEKVPSEVKLPEKLKPSHQEQNSCYSLDFKDQSGDRKKLQNEQEEDPRRKFSFPVIWMPYDMQKEVEANDHKAKEDGREMSKMPSTEHVQEPSPTLKVLPLKHADGHERTGKTRSTQDNTDGKAVEKNSSQKSIPVKQIGHHEEKISEDPKRETIEVPVKQADDGVSKASQSNRKRQSSSSSKTAKLPPVCLRVDPLPRKKSGSGSPRSPSPPGQKRRAEVAKDSSGVHASSNLKDNTEQALKNIEMEPNRKEVRTIKVMEGAPAENKEADLRTDVDLKHLVSLPNESYNEASASTIKAEDGNKSASGNEKSDKVVDKAAEVPIEVEKQMDLSKSADGEHEKQTKKNLTEAEAAVLIQSIYRGFEVRRWDPLKKLKQTDEVRAQLADVRNHIKALECSEQMVKDNKQIAGVGEMIMRLLLKLDSIQGLHSSLREIRKSLARELVTLQEKLDSLMVEKSKKCTEEVSSSGSAYHVDTIVDVGSKEVQNQKLEESTCQTICDHFVPVVDLPGSQCITNELSESSENEPGLIVEQMEKAGMEGLGVSEMAETEKSDSVRTIPEQSVQLPSTAEEKTSSEEEIIMGSVKEKLSCDSNGEEAVKELEESVQGVISEKPAIASEMGEHTEGEENESLLTRRMDRDTSADPVLDDQCLPAEDGHPKYTENNAEMEELPIGAVEAEPLEPPYEKCEQVLFEGDPEKSEILKEECSGKLIEQKAQETMHTVESDDRLKAGTPEPQMDTVQQLWAVDMVNEQQVNSPPEGGGSQQDREEKHGLISDTSPQIMAIPVDDMGQQPVCCEKEEEEVTERIDHQEEGGGAHESLEHDLLPITEQEEEKEEANKESTRLIEENERLREMMRKLMETGKEQLSVISDLTGRVKDLENKLSLSRKKKKKVRTMRRATSESSRYRMSNASSVNCQ